MNHVEPALLEKLKELPPSRFTEVADFIDFIFARSLKEDQLACRQANAAASEPAFAKVWDNDEDAAYDDL